nr:hypothetical protein [Anaerolineae bacterium]
MKIRRTIAFWPSSSPFIETIPRILTLVPKRLKSPLRFHTLFQKGNRRQPEAHTPEDAAGIPRQARDGAQRPPPGRDGSSEGEKPTGNTTTGSPAATAAHTASSEPRDEGEDTKATSPAPGPDAATNRTKASDRRRSRPTSDGHRPDPDPEQDGHEQRPPAHQDTDAPEAAARDTREKAEQRQKPRLEGPPTAKTASRAPEARAAERAKASAPEAQPTATPRPDRTTEATTRATSDAAEEGSAREPQNPTKPKRDTATPPQKTRTPKRPTKAPPPGRAANAAPKGRQDIAGRSPTPEQGSKGAEVNSPLHHSTPAPLYRKAEGRRPAR